MTQTRRDQLIAYGFRTGFLAEACPKCWAERMVRLNNFRICASCGYEVETSTKE